MNGSSSSGDHQMLQSENEIRSELLRDDTITPEQATNTAGVGMFQVKLVILSGFVWMARGFETIIVVSTIPLLACTWSLTRYHGAILNTVTFISTILGCFLYGIWSDKYGRRTAISSSLIFLFVFGAVSAGLPSFTWFAIFRAVADFSIGGFAQSLVLCCEYFPCERRGRAIYVLSCFFALGVVIMLWIVDSTMAMEDSWRIVVALGTLPAFVAMVLMRFFPESFRHLLIRNHPLPANEIVAEMVETNGKKICGRLFQVADTRSASLVKDFFTKPFLRSSILFWWMGFVTSICFSGLEVLTPQLLHEGVGDVHKSVNISISMDFMGDMQQPIVCMKSMPTTDFIFILWTTALDFPSFIIYMILVDVIDRKVLLCASYGLGSLFILLLFVPSPKTIMYIVFVYCARTLLHGQFDLILLMVAETFPTSHRGRAVGFEIATFYVGQFLSSYINQSLLWQKIMYYLILYGLLTFLCSLACLGLKHETRGKELQDVIKKEPEGILVVNNRD